MKNMERINKREGSAKATYNSKPCETCGEKMVITQSQKKKRFCSGKCQREKIC